MALRRKAERSIDTKASSDIIAHTTRQSTRKTSTPVYNKDDLDRLLRQNRRQKSKQDLPETLSQIAARDIVIESVEETVPTEPNQPFDSVFSDSESYRSRPESEETIDPLELYFNRIGYFPTCNEETLGLIKLILEDAEVAQSILDTSKMLLDKLERHRNIRPDATDGKDNYVQVLRNLKSYLPVECEESSDSRKAQEALWRLDHMKCKQNNEAFYQRTLMMSMIDRSRLFWDKTKKKPNRYDFSVETVWACRPMPTNGIPLQEDLLSRPKPDLCVSFRMNAIISQQDLKFLPIATLGIMRAEGHGRGRKDRVFPFMTIEAKRASSTSDDPDALCQSLNDASQALHNMYEFLREAERTEVFFEKVRFFTISALPDGIVVRIHRGTEISNTKKRGQILPDYPLEFYYEEFARLVGDNYSRQNVIDIFERILWGYGKALFEELQQATEIVVEKFEKHPELCKDRKEFYYSHGQEPPERLKKDPKPSTQAVASPGEGQTGMVRDRATDSLMGSDTAQPSRPTSAYGADGRSSRATRSSSKRSRAMS